MEIATRCHLVGTTPSFCGGGGEGVGCGGGGGGSDDDSGDGDGSALNSYY